MTPEVCQSGSSVWHCMASPSVMLKTCGKKTCGNIIDIEMKVLYYETCLEEESLLRCV